MTTQLVTDYGADPLGIEDSTDAIHAGQEAAGEGGVLRFPPGTYKTHGLHTKARIWLFGSQDTRVEVRGAGSTVSGVIVRYDS